MEIYKLKDFEKVDQNTGEVAEFRVTDIKQAVKNENRVNVFVNNKYSFSLDIAQLVDFKIKKGQAITEVELEKFKNASEFGKLYQRTLEWVLVRPRSTREVKDYLFKKSIQPIKSKDPETKKTILKKPTVDRAQFADQIINRLGEKGYLDDERFAKYYVENRFVKKGISKKRLGLELAQKGIAKEIIDQVLDIRSDEEEIRKIIAKKSKRYDADKMISYLTRQGFHFETVRNLVQDFYGTDSQSLE
ncbi:RecX family transcriptional regulator [Candidatus Saccharibacteria bacterium]|nr:RecX family transcriptional regulator [Candidatus Saccharibacteria bacterium]